MQKHESHSNGEKLGAFIQRNRLPLVLIVAVLVIGLIALVVFSLISDSNNKAVNSSVESVIVDYSEWNAANDPYAEAYLAATSEDTKASTKASILELDKKYLGIFDAHYAAHKADLAGLKSLQCQANIFTSSYEFTKDNKDLERAVENYKLIISDFPKSDLAPAALFNIAGIYQQMGKDEDAVKAYQDYVTKYSNSMVSSKDGEMWEMSAPTVPMAYYLIGAIKEKKGDYKGALEAYKAIGDKYSKSSWYNLAVDASIRLEAAGKAK
jgi:TolA-binding protein